jgi:hypothetical protein
MVIGDRVQVDLGQLSDSATALASLRDRTFLDPDEPFRPGGFQALDDAGALGPVHDLETAAEFDRAARLSLAVLEALLVEHEALLHGALTAMVACYNGYVSTEQALTAQYEAAANGYAPNVYPAYRSSMPGAGEVGF